ncbi:hypothetical protein LNTAR_11066 [Lentisphaera araneosa HTCC2155]|uniref:Uncharacterized protein n=2 Tax=Lentisphaera TaxID=256846 RepID=A6DJ16_9BACT|nr:hypothetical protein LNTAR_11066 [Lentisphaera araneosa HTCC2155]
MAGVIWGYIFYDHAAFESEQYDSKRPKVVIKGKNKLGRDELKKSLRKVNENVAFTALVESEDLATYEGVHFTTEGIWVLGERFAEAYLKMKK